MISVRSLYKIYRLGGQDLFALNDVSLHIPAGDFVAVMGASGSGKSTLLNILGCLDIPTKGSYLLAGQEVATCTEQELAVVRNRYLGFVFQSFHLLPNTSALENVELPLIYARVRQADRRAKARAALERVGLADRLHHLPNQLSGGQQQRVAIARALVNQPQLLLADEPTGALDSTTSQEIMALLAKLNREGMTLVMVTHEAEVAACAKRTLHFRDGRVA